MSSLLPPLTESASIPVTSAYAGGLPIIALLLLLLLVVAKQTSIDVSSAEYRRLSACLDVGVAPLALCVVAISANEISRILS
jgi:hypothetical protein